LKKEGKMGAVDNLTKIANVYLKEHLITTTMSAFFAIISTIILNKIHTGFLLLQQISPTKNVLIELGGSFCLWFTVCFYFKKSGTFLLDNHRLKKEIKDKLNKLSHEEKIVIATMFYTRDLPAHMIGLESLESKGIIEVNDKVVLRCGVTIGHPVEFNKIVEKVLNKKTVKTIDNQYKNKVKINYWQVSEELSVQPVSELQQEIADIKKRHR
jgi:hypothetical protein